MSAGRKGTVTVGSPRRPITIGYIRRQTPERLDKLQRIVLARLAKWQSPDPEVWPARFPSKRDQRGWIEYLGDVNMAIEIEQDARRASR